MRAMMAATYGPSADIISHVAARGSQNQRMVERASAGGRELADVPGMHREGYRECGIRGGFTRGAGRT